MRPRVWAGLLLGTVTLSSATDAWAQGATCRSDAHQLPAPLVGTWHEFTVAPAGLVFEGELRSSLEAGGCAFIQTFVSSDSTFTFRSLGYVDHERNTWFEHFVLSDGRTASYQWERDGADILLNRTEPVAGRFRLRVTAIQANSYVVVEERRATDSAEWRQGERTLTRRVSGGGRAEPGSAADLGARSRAPRSKEQSLRGAQAVPEARAHHQLVYHAGDTRTYLIGGSTSQGEGHRYFDDVWSWDGTAWTQTEALPFPRSSHRVIYHAQRNALILFGGGFAQAVRAEGVIWEWRAGAWRAIGGNFRAGADEPEMCYDRGRQRVVIFGGWDAAGQFRGETWEWDSAGLARVDSAGPSPRAGHAFLYDPVRARCLLFGGRGSGGYHADTWEWDGVRWRQLGVRGPSARWFFGSATDPTSGRIVIFGGRGPDAPVPGRDAAGDFGDTWAWDGHGWEQLQITGPPPRSGAKLAFAGGSIVLFGGREERADAFHDRNDLWELQGRSWVQRH